MTQDATQRWNRTEGVLVAPGSTPDDVAARLRERAVVARLEWYPVSAHLLSITLLSDAEGRVAVTPPSRGGVVPGAGVSELAEGLARELGADVTIGPASFNALPEGVELPEVSAGPSPMSRTVVVSPLSAYMVPLQATLLERPLAVASAPGIDRRIVMYSGEGAELGAFGWDDESLPAIIFRVDERDITVRAVLTGEPEDDAVYSWSMTSRYVWGGVEEPGPALSALVNEMLTDSTDASLIARAMYDGWFEVRVKNIFGKKKVDAFFDRNYGRSAAVKALVDTLKIRSDGVNPFQAEAERRKITIDDLLQSVRELAAEERPRQKMTGSIYRFAKKASDSEMWDLAHVALHEEHETVRALLLKPFGLKTTWRRPFPLDISPLMEYAWSENTLLAESAIDCLEAFKDKRIHDLAVQLLERKGLGSFALALLIRNYRKTDDALIAGLIGKSGVIPHHVQQDIREIYCRHRSADALPILLHTYRRGECAFCRHYIVRAMHRCGGVPMKILKECLYDCYDETRDFAKRLIKRSSIHSEGDGMNVRQL